MGYSTDFKGSLKITPELTFSHASNLNKIKILENSFDNIPEEYTDLSYCQWIINNDGELAWDGNEKFRDYIENLKGLIDLFFIPNNYSLSGELNWQGEDIEDVGKIIVNNNTITILNETILCSESKKRDFKTLDEIILTSSSTGQPLEIDPNTTVDVGKSITYKLITKNDTESYNVSITIEAIASPEQPI